MRSIRINNPKLDSYITDLAEDYVAEGVSIVTRSNNSFQANDLVVFGNPKEELTESKKIDAISGNTGLTLASTLKFSHNKGTPIYKTVWDFISIEGRSSSLGSFAQLSLSPIQWDNEKGKTIYYHSDGNDNWEYRIRFYNSVTSAYSEYSPTQTGIGFQQQQMGYIIRDARLIAGDQEGNVLTTEECLRFLTRAKNAIRGHNPRYWFWKVIGYISNKSIAATANNSIYNLDDIDDLGIIDTIEYRYTSGNEDIKYNLRGKSDSEFNDYVRDINRPTDDKPRTYRLLPPDANSTKGYFEINTKIANNDVGRFYINYYKIEENYNSADDTTSIIIPEILCDYLASKIFAAKGNENMAKTYMKYFTGPRNRGKTQGGEELTGIALLDELDRQYKKPAGQPTQFFRFRGQRAMSRLYGSSRSSNPDYNKENYFNDER